MKKSIYAVLMVAALLAIHTEAFAIGAAGRDTPATSGARLENNVDGKEWDAPKVITLVRWPFNNNGGVSQTNVAAPVSGDVVIYDFVTADDGVTIRKTSTSADGAVAGVLVTSIQTSDSAEGTSSTFDSGRRNWGYMMIHGPVIANLTASGGNGCSTGDAAITSTDVGKVTTLENDGISPNFAQVKAAGNKVGVFMDSCSSATTNRVFVEAE